MSFEILSGIRSPKDLSTLSETKLVQLADEIREALLTIVSDRAAHFASNLGVVELCIALHLTFDFSKDRLIWDTGYKSFQPIHSRISIVPASLPQTFRRDKTFGVAKECCL